MTVRVFALGLPWGDRRACIAMAPHALIVFGFAVPLIVRSAPCCLIQIFLGDRTSRRVAVLLVLRPSLFHVRVVEPVPAPVRHVTVDFVVHGVCPFA